MIADTKANKKLRSKVTELFMRDRKLNISLVFISIITYFNLSKHTRLNATHCFVMKIPNTRELQIASNHSSDIEFEDFMILEEDYTKAKFSCSVSYITLS